MEYPDQFIRGISDSNCVDDVGRVSGALFQFSDKSRPDEFHESSINWYDDEGALRLIMEQRKESDLSQFQFKTGAAIIERSDADRIIANPSYNNVFSYERCPITGNKYHGNLLRKDKTIKKMIQTVIAASLAMNAKVIYREQFECNMRISED